VSKNDQISKRLEEMKKSKAANTSTPEKMIDGIVKQEEKKTDFEKIAQELQERHEKEAVGANEDYVKDTLYIQKDIYKAFNALCIKRGDKKHHVNKALAEYVEREYKRIQREK